MNKFGNAFCSLHLFALSCHLESRGLGLAARHLREELGITIHLTSWTESCCYKQLRFGDLKSPSFEVFFNPSILGISLDTSPYLIILSMLPESKKKENSLSTELRLQPQPCTVTPNGPPAREISLSQTFPSWIHESMKNLGFPVLT